MLIWKKIFFAPWHPGKECATILISPTIESLGQCKNTKRWTPAMPPTTGTGYTSMIPPLFWRRFGAFFWRIWWHLQKVLKDMTPTTICNGNLHLSVKSGGNLTSIECQVLSQVLLISVRGQKIFAENWVKVVILAEWANIFWYTVLFWRIWWCIWWHLQKVLKDMSPKTICNLFWFFKNNFPIYHKNRKWVTMGNNGPPHKWPSENTWFKKRL